MKKAVFIDRDSLLSLPIQGGQQKTPLTLEVFHVNDSLRPGLQRLKSGDFALIATTNQPDLSRGLLPRRELDRMHDVLRRALPLDDILVCPHADEDHCPCRKPRAGNW